MTDAIRETAWPGAAWDTWPDPKSTGLDERALARALACAEAAGSAAVLVVRDGRIAASLGEPAHKLPCHSIRQSLLCALIGVAVEQGRIDLSSSLESLGSARSSRASSTPRNDLAHGSVKPRRFPPGLRPL